MKSKNLIQQVYFLDDKLRQYALSLTQNQEDANDLLQDTYLKVLQNSDHFTENTNLKAWVFTIMRNTFINTYRRKLRCKITTDDSTDSFYLTNHVQDANDAADLHLYVSEISRAILRMKEPQRMALELFIDGFKYQEIADILDLSIGTVKSRIHFARQKLMHSLSDYYPMALPLSA